MNAVRPTASARGTDAGRIVMPASKRTRWIVDTVIAVFVAALTTVGVWAELATWPHPIVFPAGAYLIGLASSAVLLLRRDRPFVCALAVFALVLLYHESGYPGAAPAMALFVAVYTLAERASSLSWIGVAVLFVLAWPLVQVLPPNATSPASYAITGPAVGMLVFIALGVAARQLRISHAREVTLAGAQAEAAANERIAQDRLRIAREVHDVLAHTLSAVAVQSAAAIDAFDAGEPQRARESLERIRSLTKQANPEVRRAVEDLRGGDAPTRAPQPGLRDLDHLVAGARQSGLDVGVEVTGALTSVSPVTGLTAYRIVQEAITNVLKHANASHVDVTVHDDGDVLVVDVTDDGVADIHAAANDGFGIRGMQERAAAVGGTVSTAPRASGGFAVHAELPLSHDTADAASSGDEP
ncbi:sensor histidine kinase [Humibacter soli]